MRDWSDVLPADIARKQHAYERRRRAWQMRQAGMVYREIGADLGVCLQQAKVLVGGHERRMRHNALSPIEAYLTGSDNLRLSTMRKFSRNRERPLLDLKNLSA